MLAAATSANGMWRFHAHPEVWVLVGGLVFAYVYMVRVVGPRAVPEGQKVVTGKQLTAFVTAMLLLWVGSDWPLHDLAENYLYSLHMVQHMILTYFVPPLALLATPEWLARLLLGKGRAYAAAKWLTFPIASGLIFSAVTMVSHVPGVVNTSVQVGPFHYTMHVLLVLSALIMWTPVCGPIPEFRIGYGAKILYLFLMSVMPMVPAGWLTFADGVVYKRYDRPFNVWGMTPTDDQQLAGAIMKMGGSLYLWTICIVIFFRRFMGNWESQQQFSRRHRYPDAEVVRTTMDGEPLTFDQVHSAFERVPAPPEPASPPASPAAGD